MKIESGLAVLKEELIRVLSGGAKGQSRRIKGVIDSFDKMDEDFCLVMERYIEVNLANGLTISEMAQAYIFFLAENDKEEMYFFQHGKYRYDRLEDVLSHVYNNGEYMQKYMVGLAVSMIIWPQHREYFRYFSDFLAGCGKYSGSYLEVGAGHGIFFSEALQRGNFSQYDVLDISEKSLELTKRIISGHKNEKRVNFIHQDFLKFTGSKYDVISIGEVLEHVEEPVAFLQKCREIVDQNGLIYITACINAPEVDHIYLFESVQQVENLISEANLEIVDKLYIPYRDYSLERCSRQKLPINVAYVLKRK